MDRCPDHGKMVESIQQVHTGNALLELELKHATATMGKISATLERMATKLESLEGQIEESRRSTELKRSVLVLVGTALTVGGGLTGTVLTLIATHADKLRLMFS